MCETSLIELSVLKNRKPWKIVQAAGDGLVCKPQWFAHVELVRWRTLGDADEDETRRDSITDSEMESQ